MAAQLLTERLHLRELRQADLLNIHALHSLKETDEYNTLGIPENLLETEILLAEWLIENQREPKQFYRFCLELRESKQFIGLLGLNLGKEKYRTGEVWFKIHKDHWNKGYTTEAVKKVLEFAFSDLKLHRIEAGCAVENIASGKVLEKAGMLKEGRKRKKLPIRGEWKDNYFYAILEEDFYV